MRPSCLSLGKQYGQSAEVSFQLSDHPLPCLQLGAAFENHWAGDHRAPLSLSFAPVLKAQFPPRSGELAGLPETKSHGEFGTVLTLLFVFLVKCLL